MSVQTLAPVPMLWADVQVGMMTFKGVVTKIDRRFTKDGGVQVTVGTMVPFFAYDNETVAVYGKVA